MLHTAVRSVKKKKKVECLIPFMITAYRSANKKGRTPRRFFGVIGAGKTSHIYNHFTNVGVTPLTLGYAGLNLTNISSHSTGFARLICKH